MKVYIYHDEVFKTRHAATNYVELLIERHIMKEDEAFMIMWYVNDNGNLEAWIVQPNQSQELPNFRARYSGHEIRVVEPIDYNMKV